MVIIKKKGVLGDFAFSRARTHAVRALILFCSRRSHRSAFLYFFFVFVYWRAPKEHAVACVFFFGAHLGTKCLYYFFFLERKRGLPFFFVFCFFFYFLFNVNYITFLKNHQKKTVIHFFNTFFVLSLFSLCITERD